MTTSIARIAVESPSVTGRADNLAGLGTAVRFRYFQTISDIPRESWDRLAHGYICASHGWLKTVEETAQPSLQTVYFVLETHDRLVAAAVGQTLPAEAPRLDDHLFGRALPLARRMGLSFQPSLLCRPLRGNDEPIFLCNDLSTSDRRSLSTALLDGIEAYAADRKLTIGFAPVRHGELAQALRARGYERTEHYPVAHLDVHFSTFQEYLDHVGTISRRTRRKISNELNRNRKAGVIIHSLTDLDPVRRRVHELFDQHYRRLNGVPFPYTSDFLGAVRRNFGKSAMVYGAFKKGQLIAAAVMVHQGRVGWGTALGVDHEASGNDFTYFNLAYYRPVGDAIELGLKRLNCGTLAYEAKRLRGCTISPTHLYYLPRTSTGRVAVPLWFRLHTREFRRKFPAWIWESRASAPEDMADHAGSPAGEAKL